VSESPRPRPALVRSFVPAILRAFVLAFCIGGAASCEAGAPPAASSAHEDRAVDTLQDVGAARLAAASTAGIEHPCASTVPDASFLWKDFVGSTSRGREAILPDFSYAGYRYSNEPLPQKVPGEHFDVRDFGAHPDDGHYDDAGIQAAIAAAVAAGGGTVRFPPGRFLLSPNRDPSAVLTVEGSGVVLKGSGSGPGGTELFIDERKADRESFILTFRASAAPVRQLATITADAERQSFHVDVDDASLLQEGARVVLTYRHPAYAEQYFAPLEIAPEWTRLQTAGLRVHEIHRVEELSGNRVRFAEPLHMPIRVHDEAPFRLLEYHDIREVGVEDLAFVGGWGSHPEEFRHHRDAVHDYGWNALRFDRVTDGWIRRVEFRDLNQGVLLHASAAITVDSVRFTGKKGHMSILSRFGYGILVRDALDLAGNHHGPGVGYSAAGTVYLRYRMQEDQQIDSHTGTPYATLFDDVTGGVLTGNGGPFEGYPHHGRDLVFWNFRHRSSRGLTYDFWNTRRRQSATFARPVFAGFVSATPVRFRDEEEKVRYNEAQGNVVSPLSLFEAQLALRKCSARNGHQIPADSVQR
jgi:hypothetical protein